MHSEYQRAPHNFGGERTKGTLMREILAVRTIAYCRVHWEKYSYAVMRCFGCQSYGHSIFYCQRKLKC